MALQREMAKAIRAGASSPNVVPWFQKQEELSPFQKFWKENVYPIWFKTVKGPWDRYHYERMVSDLRGYGLMFDDCYHDKEPIVERALELLPHDLHVQRYRRMVRGTELSLKKSHMPLETQNYDPMIPYLAPYIEEAKFQVQEESELLKYHPWDHKLFTGGVSGLGEKNMHSTLLTCT